MSKLSKALLFVMFLSSASLYGNSIFKKADSFHHTLNSAKSSRKLLLSYAARSSAPCCIAMEKATFHDQKVQNILKTSFYPVKVDLSTPLGQKWANNFQIVNTPTLLFFDDHGMVIKKVENCISSSELTVILEEVLFFNKNGFWPIEKDIPVVLPLYVPEKSTTKPTPSTYLNDQQSTYTNSSNSTIGVLLDQIPINDSSIQSALEQTKLRFPQYHFIIKLIKSSQQSFYRVSIKNFRECREAQIFLDTLKEQGFEKCQLFCNP